MHDDYNYNPKSKSKIKDIISLILALILLALGIFFAVEFIIHQEITHGLLAMFDCSIGLIYTMESIDRLIKGDNDE